MEIKVSADGEVTLVVTNGETDRALEFVHALQADARRKERTISHSQTMREANTKVGSSNLNQIQYRTWEYLCENDNNEGIHVSQLAKAFGLTRAAANSRLLVIEKLGYAKRVHKGYYRALTPENG
jgi:DNA-binding MarR family transcriptional regulator